MEKLQQWRKLLKECETWEYLLTVWAETMMEVEKFVPMLCVETTYVQKFLNTE